MVTGISASKTFFLGETTARRELDIDGNQTDHSGGINTTVSHSRGGWPLGGGLQLLALFCLS